MTTNFFDLQNDTPVKSKLESDYKYMLARSGPAPCRHIENDLHGCVPK